MAIFGWLGGISLKLYPLVARKEGLEACEEALHVLARYKSLVSKSTMMEMIQTVLDNNVFGFGDKNYIQKEGFAIGSRLGNLFACAYMRKWNQALLQ